MVSSYQSWRKDAADRDLRGKIDSLFGVSKQEIAAVRGRSRLGNRVLRGRLTRTA
jgi:hypothetical protein